MTRCERELLDRLARMVMDIHPDWREIHDALARLAKEDEAEAALDRELAECLIDTYHGAD